MNDNIFKFCRIGDLRSVKYLVEEAKINPEIRNKFGETPLHGASRYGHLEIVKYFIRHDVDTSIKNKKGKLLRPS